MPTAMAQQLMGACQRLDAVIDRSHDIRGGRVGTLCLGDDGTDRREHILYAMVELGIQKFLGLLGSLALRNVDVDADRPLRFSLAIIGNETPRFDLSNLTAGENDTILDVIFAPALAERFTPEHLQSLNVLWVHTSQPFAARDLGRSVWKTVDGCIAW